MTQVADSLGDTLVVLTIDQRASRVGPDLVEGLVATLNGPEYADVIALPFERTAGDELQGVLTDAAAAVRIALRLARTGQWSTGIGVGPVRTPLPNSTRAAHGPAFEHARTAVERAKDSPETIAVDGPDETRARHAEAVLALLAAVVLRRSPAGQEVVDLLAEGLTQTEVAARLGISKQAVSQRARAALWTHEQATVPAAAALLDHAGSSHDPG